MGHCGATAPQQVVLTSFHMPLFFFLSGLFLFRKEENLGEFVKKKAKTLLFPCLVFGAILSTYSTCIDLIKHDDTIPYGLRYVGLFINMRQNPFPGSLWFFPCLFLVELMMFALHRWSRSEKVILVCSSLLAVAGLAVHHYYGKGLPWSMDIALYCIPFTATGYALRGKVLNAYPWISYIIAAVLFSVSAYFNYVYIGQSVDLYNCILGSYPLFYLTAFTGIYLVIGLAKLWKNKPMLLFYGRNSMLVYALHFLFLLSLRVLLSNWVPDGIIYNLLATTIILLILIPIIKLINRRYKWMMGKF